jgi:two-component sensor histidine kinase
VNSDLELSVKDNGVGFPGDLDYRQTQSLGLQLIMSLVDQVQGEIQLIRENGTEFKIQIPVASSIAAA